MQVPAEATSRSDAERSHGSTRPELLYFTDLAEHEMLSAEQEVTLSRTIECGVAAARALATGTPVAIDRAETARLSSLVEDGNEAGRCLIESNLRLVVWIARRYAGMGVPLLDLVQEGNLGLHHAVWHFDWRRGVRFSTYAYWWIRQAIVAAMRSQGRSIRLPAEVQANITAVRRAEAALREEFSHEPTLAEIAQRAGVSEQTVDQARTALTPVVSLDEPCSRDARYTWQEVIPDERAHSSGLVRVEQDETAKQLRTLLDVLDHTERTVVELRFGLDDRGPYSVRELAEAMGASRAEIRELLDRAMAKVRRHAKPMAEKFNAA
jgi:DNA-directed RNA polymerase sigma subunit (sigma70/sigma32)